MKIFDSMRKYMLLLTAVCGLLAGCQKAGPAVPATIPEVVFSEITETSFKASWEPIEGAEGYRCEVSMMNGEDNVAIRLNNITQTSFTVDRLRPGQEYKVRVAVRSGNKTSREWFNGTVTTAGSSVSCTFELLPFEKYDASSGYVLPYAKVTPSEENAYYWVSAVPLDQKENAAAWIQEDIDLYVEEGWDWETMQDEGMILIGKTESVPFAFTGRDNYCFTAALIENTMGGIRVCSEPSFSYTFYSEAKSVKVHHPGIYDDFVGDWVVHADATVIVSGGVYDRGEGKSFPVTIRKSGDGKSLELVGWGGQENGYSSYPLKCDYIADSEGRGYDSFGISFPQDIVTEDGVKWQWVSWQLFNGIIDGEVANDYYPYDDTSLEELPEFSFGYYGYVANRNKTVLKIFAKDYVDETGQGVYNMGIWPYGTASDGSGGRLPGGMHSEPVAPYVLVRQDVADGVCNPIPEMKL